MARSTPAQKPRGAAIKMVSGGRGVGRWRSDAVGGIVVSFGSAATRGAIAGLAASYRRWYTRVEAECDALRKRGAAGHGLDSTAKLTIWPGPTVKKQGFNSVAILGEVDCKVLIGGAKVAERGSPSACT